MLHRKSNGRSKSFLALLAVFGVVATSCGSGASNASNSTTTAATGTTIGGTVNIGFGGPLTGQSAHLGQSMISGLDFGTSLINADGGVLGANVKIVPADLTDPVDAVPAIRQLLAAGNIKGFIGFSVVNYENSLPIVNAANMVSFTLIGSAALDNANMPYMFRMAASDSLGGTAMGVAAKLLGYKRVVVVSDTVTGAPALVQSAAVEMKKEGITVPDQILLPTSVPSYQAEAAKIVGLHPDAIVGQFATIVTGPFFTALRAAGGGSIPFIGSDTSTVDWLKAAGMTDANDTVVEVAGAAESGSAVSQFITDYQAKYHVSPLAFATEYYDSLNVMTLAMLDCKSVNPQVYVKCIPDVTTPGPNITTVYNFADGKKLLSEGKKIKYAGVSGPMTFNSHHDVTGSFQVQKVSIATGQITVLQTISASTLSQAIK